MIKQSYFITGTDTDIGKTVVSTILAVGLGADYWKPIQTGSNHGTDSEIVARWIGRSRTHKETYVFPEAVSPHLASDLANTEIDFQRCMNDFRDRRHSRVPLIIEGAGGVLVPIHSSYLMIDLIQAFKIPAIVVAGTRLGTINHTLLTLEALARRNIPVAGIITNGQEDASALRSLEEFGKAKVLGHIPHCRSFSHDWFHTSFLQLSTQERGVQGIK